MKHLAQLIFALVFSFATEAVHAFQYKYSYDSKKYNVSVFDTSDYQLIQFNGEVLPLDTDKGLREAVKVLTPNKRTILAIGVSNGGEGRVFNKFGRAIQRACPRESCVFTTYVKNLCSSACVWLHLHGYDRVSSEHAVFGFHRKFVGVGPLHVVVQSKENLREMFVGHGVDAAWLDANMQGLTSRQKSGAYARPSAMMNGKFVHRIHANFEYEFLPYRTPEFHTMVVLPPKGGAWLEEKVPSSLAVSE